MAMVQGPPTKRRDPEPAAAPATPPVVPAVESRWVPTEESLLRAGRPMPCPDASREFSQLCGGCHSAYGASAISTVPNLFTYVGGAEGTSAAFLAQVRMPTPKMGTMASMPSFPAAMISDADVNQIYEYFKAGTPGATPTCPSMGGNEMTNLGSCSGQALTYSPLFASGDTQLKPVSYVDPATKHIIFRGAGRVRFRHEMEDTFAIYHDHYFEDRTFEYILDDSIPAGGTTITVTYLPNSNQYYSKQMLAPQQQGGADLNIRAWKIYGGVDGNAFATNAGGAANNVLPTGCTPDPNSPSCNTQKYTFTISRNDREHRAIQMGDQLQIEFGIFMARYPAAGRFPYAKHSAAAQGLHAQRPALRQRLLHAGQLLLRLFPLRRRQGHAHPYNQDCTMTVPPEMENSFPHPYDCSANGPSPKRSPPVPSRPNGTRRSRLVRWHRDDVVHPPASRSYYSQMSPNILGENAANFAQGRRLFHIDYTTGKHTEVNNDLPLRTSRHMPASRARSSTRCL